MLNWEERLNRVWQAIQNRFTTTDAVLLGVCAYLANSLSVPVAALRIVLSICAFFWPVVTIVVYVVVSYFIEPSDSEQ